MVVGVPIDLLFDAETPLGFRVRVAQSRWEMIVQEKHPAMQGRESESSGSPWSNPTKFARAGETRRFSCSIRLLAAFRRGEYIAVLSSVTAAEVEQAPEVVRLIHAELIGAGAELLSVSIEAMGLLDKYMAKGILGPKFQNDMLHIALATAADADVLVSWNFRHIVRLNKIRLFNAVNIECGYKVLTICSPREVVPDETNE